MDLSTLREQLVLLEARALELGMANPSPHLLEELRYSLHDVTILRDQLPRVNGTHALCARADTVYAEFHGIQSRWNGVGYGCTAA